MPNEPTLPNGFKPAEEFEPCPKCHWKGYARIGPQKRCSSCGHQWPPVRRVQQVPTRTEILSGTARIAPTRIIRWRF